MAQVEAAQLSVGVNQHGVRNHNERLILSMIQRHGPMPGSDIAKRAGLSPQTVSVILRGLEREGFLERGDPQRGRVGKPSIPMGIAANGSFAVGLKVGRRSADLVLTNLSGQVCAEKQKTYKYPAPDTIMEFLKDGLAEFYTQLGKSSAERISGIGIAIPFEVWNWHETIGAPPEEMARWKDFDIAEAVRDFTNLDVFIENDATAACRAEHVYGRGREFSDFAYFFIGSFVGGGIVLNNSVFDGAQGNAGALGSLPVSGPEKKPKQLIDVASLYLLEDKLAQEGIDHTRLWSQPLRWGDFSDSVAEWVESTGHYLARAALTACAVVDFEAVLIDGAFPAEVGDRLVERVRAEIGDMDSRGLLVPRIERGRVGPNARAMGASSAPIFAKYLLNTNSGHSFG